MSLISLFSAHWFTLHARCLAPCGLFVFLSRLQLTGSNWYMRTFVASTFKTMGTARVDQTNGSSSPAAVFWLSHVQTPGRMWREEGQGAVMEGTALPPKGIASQTLHLISCMNFINSFLNLNILLVSVTFCAKAQVTISSSSFFFVFTGNQHTHEQWNKWVLGFCFGLLSILLLIIL